MFQAENAALAITAAQVFCSDFDREKTRTGLEKTRFVGRIDIRSLHKRTIVLDGAHNPQKMQALVDTIRVLYPDRKIVRYAAFKQGKDWKEMLDIMQVLSQQFIIGSFAGAQDISFQSVAEDDIKNYLPSADIQSCPDPKEFFVDTKILIPEDTVVVLTGSLYRLGRVYAIL